MSEVTRPGEEEPLAAVYRCDRCGGLFSLEEPAGTFWIRIGSTLSGGVCDKRRSHLLRLAKRVTFR